MSSQIANLFAQELSVINLGLVSFADDLRRAGGRAVQVDWRPPVLTDAHLLDALDRCAVDERVARANAEAVARVIAAKPVLVDIGLAADVVPGMHKRLVLHSGPPVAWKDMSGPTRGAVMGGLMYEGLADTPEAAAALAASGEIEFSPCHHHASVGPMAGIMTASMPVMVVENAAFGNKAFATLNEGLGKVLRYGAYDASVLERLRWMASTLAPVLKKTIALRGPVDVRSLIAQALQMGDEVHNRNRAATSLLIRALAPHMVKVDAPTADIARVLEFLDGNDHFFLNLSMAACKASLDPCHGIPLCSVISTMARNGTEFGVRVSGLGDRWFTAPSPMVDGLYLPGFSAADAAPDIGDSVITETAGLGGFSMAAAPAIVQFVGGSASQALAFTRRMYEITLAEHPTYKIPGLDFRGTPTAIDLLKVVATGIAPVVNTGIAHKEPGVGMVGAGIVRPPMACFTQAMEAFAKIV